MKLAAIVPGLMASTGLQWKPFLFIVLDIYWHLAGIYG